MRNDGAAHGVKGEKMGGGKRVPVVSEPLSRRPSFPPSLPAARTIPPKPLGEAEPPTENRENTLQSWRGALTR